MPIILVDKIQESAVRSLQEDSPPKHYAAFEFPVVIDKATNSVYYFTGTPAWGAVYFEGLRQLADEITS